MRFYFLSILSIAFILTQVSFAQTAAYIFDGNKKIIVVREYAPKETDVNKQYKRLKQFITLQKYDQVTEVPVKIGGNYVGQVIEKAILVEDAEDGKIYGEGFIPFTMRNRENFVLIFSYKFRLKDGIVKYELGNFEVKEFVHLGISKGSMGAGQAIGYGVGTGKSKSGGADIRRYPLEEVIDKNGVEQQFLAFLSSFRVSLKKALEGEL